MTTGPSHAAVVEEVAELIAGRLRWDHDDDPEIVAMRHDCYVNDTLGWFPEVSIFDDDQELLVIGKDRFREFGIAILSLIFARLSDVTPEMVEAVAKAMAADEGWGWDNPETLRDWWINQARASISAFLASSPLTPGDGNKE